MADSDWLAKRFEQNRGRLRAVAYRMLWFLEQGGAVRAEIMAAP